MRGSVRGRGAKVMLGEDAPEPGREPVREGKVRGESERRRMLGHGEGAGLDAAVDVAEEALWDVSREGALRLVEVVVWEVVLSRDPDEREVSERAAVTIAVKDAGSGGLWAASTMARATCALRVVNLYAFADRSIAGFHGLLEGCCC